MPGTGAEARSDGPGPFQLAGHAEPALLLVAVTGPSSHFMQQRLAGSPRKQCKIKLINIHMLLMEDKKR
jgi:hypothetical protein